MPVPQHTVHYLEIVTPDAAAAVKHYEHAFGWRFQQMGPELGGSFVAELPDGSRCGIRPPLRTTEAPIVRTYVRVDDIERAVQRVQEVGGKIALEPTQLGPQGTIAIYFIGPIEQGLWQTP